MKKYLAIFGTPLLISGLVATPVAVMIYASTRPARVEVYNYLDYTSPESRDRVLGEYGYKEFGDLPELRSAIENRQIPFGVGSDYANVLLASDGLLQKLDFNALFDGFTVSDRDNTTTTYTFSVKTPLAPTALKKALQALYTREAWAVMQSFNRYLTRYAAGSELWEYMIPYFIQQKVVAINPFIVTPNPGYEDDLAILKGFDQAAIDKLFNFRSYSDIMEVLSNIGFKTLAVNNYMRDNLGIGSEQVNGLQDFSMNVTNENYPSLLRGFRAIMDQFKGRKYIVDSGYETMSAVHPAGNSEGVIADAAILYNGDALDAYLGSDQIDGVTQNEFNATTRIIKPKNSSFLLDGLIIPVYVQDSALAKAQRVMRHAFLDNAPDVANARDEEGNINAYNMPYNIFDFVTYTASYQAIYDDIIAHYFEDLNGDIKNPNTSMEADPENPNTKIIKGSGAYANAMFELSDTPNERHLTTPISANLETTVQSAYSALIREIFTI